MIRPGEIYMADFAEAGPHPVIVLSRAELNRGRYALVVVCTSARFATRSQLPNCVPFHAGNLGFTADCVAQCENLLSVDVAQIGEGGQTEHTRCQRTNRAHCHGNAPSVARNQQ